MWENRKYWITLIQLARLVNWEHRATRKALYLEITRNQKLKSKFQAGERK